MRGSPEGRADSNELWESVPDASPHRPRSVTQVFLQAEASSRFGAFSAALKYLSDRGHVAFRRAYAENRTVVLETIDGLRLRVGRMLPEVGRSQTDEAEILAVLKSHGVNATITA